MGWGRGGERDQDGGGGWHVFKLFYQISHFSACLRFNFQFLETCEPQLETRYTCVRVCVAGGGGGGGGGARGKLTVVFKPTTAHYQ